MDKETVRDMISSNPAVMLYITNPWCVSCKSLRPKVEELVKERFPKMVFLYIDASVNEAVSADLSVFSAPAILVFFEGKEYIRESKFVSVDELGNKLQRIYTLMFDE